ncbi:MAG: tetratricopeptide repeat domain protein [Treponematales bacterium]
MKNTPLVKAERLIRAGKYDRAIKLLEDGDNRLAGSFSHNYLLALAYLYAGIYGAALSYFKKAGEQKLRHPPVLLGMAALYLSHGDTDRAVDIYLEILDMDERNRTAKKALAFIRKYAGTDDFAALLDAGGLRALFPPRPRLPAPSARTLVTLALSALVVGSACAGLAKSGALSALTAPRETRKGAGELALAPEEIDAPVQTSGSYRYVLTRSEVVKLYNESRRLFTAYRDDAARVGLNKLLASNASGGIKNKARLLISYMEVPGFDTLKDRFTYAEVAGDPALYDGCHIIWRGMATNLEQGENATAFDFLVGYDTRKVLEGIVRTTFNFAVLVDTGRPLEVLGRVVPEGSSLRIEGVALNQSSALGAGKQRPAGRVFARDAGRE